MTKKTKEELEYEKEKEETRKDLSHIKELVEKVPGLNRPSKELVSEYIMIGQQFILVTKGTDEENDFDMETLQALAECCPDAQLMKESIAEMKSILKEHGIVSVNFARA